MPVEAVLFDFGGVLTSGPWEAFAAYERRAGLPEGFIRRLNATNPDTNAWAQLERGKVSPEQFKALFEAEARAAGGALDAGEVLAALSGELRPEMVEAVRRCHDRLPTCLLTNNFRSSGWREGLEEVLALFDAVIESSESGLRKPDPAFYEQALDVLKVKADQAVFLDDLGINLKPARELGMQTIKVVDAKKAIAELEAVVGFELGD